LLVFPVGSAILIVAVMLWSAGVFDREYWSDLDLGALVGALVFIAYNLLPPVALAWLVLRSAPDDRPGLVVIAVGCVVFTGVLVWLLVDMLTSESSTAALIFLTLPLILGAILIFFAALAALIRHRVRHGSTSS